MSVVTTENVWGGSKKPLKASYGKLMMWFFIVSDALTFSGFLVSYGFSRFKFIESWPIADKVFTHFPFMHGQKQPMIYVALMTFILIFSSVTMVLAVDAGHHMKKKKVAVYMLLTILGGGIFVGSQAWEWKNFIKGEYGAVETRGGRILQFVDVKTREQISLKDFVITTDTDRERHQNNNSIWFSEESTLPNFTVKDITNNFLANKNILIRTELITESGQKTILTREESELRLKSIVRIVQGANLHRNEYGHPLFANFFFFITGFHGFHVFSGVVFNVIIFCNIVLGTYEKRKHYEMVEKVGLYWHFVDLVWVFVFTFFYLV